MRQIGLVNPTRQPEGPAMLWGIPQDAEYQRRYRIIQSWCDSRPHDVRQYRTLHVASCTAGCEERWSTHRCVIGLATLDWLEGIRHGVTPGIPLEPDTDTDTEDTEDTLTIAPLTPTIRHASLSAALAAVQVELGSTTDETTVVLGRHGISVTSQIVSGEEGPSLLTSLTHTDDGGHIVHVESTWPLAWEAGLESVQEQLSVARRCSLELLAGRPSGVPAPASVAPQDATPEPDTKPAPKRRSKRKSKPEDAPPPGVDEATPSGEPAPPIPKVEPPTVHQLAQWLSEQEGRTAFDKEAIREAFKSHNAGRIGAKTVYALMQEGAKAGLWLWDPSKPELVLEPGGSADEGDDFDEGDDIPPEPAPKEEPRTLGHPLAKPKGSVIVEDAASPEAVASSRRAVEDTRSVEQLEAEANRLMGKLFDVGDWAAIENAARDNGIPYTEADGPKFDGAPLPWIQRFVAQLNEATELL